VIFRGSKTHKRQLGESLVLTTHTFQAECPLKYLRIKCGGIWLLIFFSVLRIKPRALHMLGRCLSQSCISSLSHFNSKHKTTRAKYPLTGNYCQSTAHWSFWVCITSIRNCRLCSSRDIFIAMSNRVFIYSYIAIQLCRKFRVIEMSWVLILCLVVYILLASVTK
jgi:hypothetical protein